MRLKGAERSSAIAGLVSSFPGTDERRETHGHTTGRAAISLLITSLLPLHRLAAQPSAELPFRAMKLLLPLLLAPLALAAPFSIFERRDAPPSTWSLSPRAPRPETILPLRIGLAQSNLHKLEVSLLEVSDPESEHYGKHWSAEKVADFFAPAEEAVAGVRAWLEEHGLEKERVKLSKSKTWLMIDVTVEQAEKLLAAKYETYEHVSGSKRLGESDHLLAESRAELTLLLQQPAALTRSLRIFASTSRSSRQLSICALSR